MFDIENLMKSTAWPFIEARRVYSRIGGKVPSKNYVLFETGYGPSGLPHIGTFAEVTRTTMVREAFSQICDIPTKLICFSDDMDGLRKVPSNLPNQHLIEPHLGKSLTSIPDPFGEKKSFGHYMNAKLCSFLDRFNFEYNFYSATECYQSGMFDNMMLKVLEKYEQIMDLMLPTLGQERQKTYSPFMPICPDSFVVLQVAIEKIDKENGSIFYRNENNQLIETLVTGGNCKLQWKPDFGMRWAALDVDYEMYGKDHMPNGPIYSKICEIISGRPPVQFFYELFLDKDGSKISKSKGNSVSVDEWLRYAPKESIALFMYQSPSKAKRLYFDIIPKSVDEYLAFNKKYHDEEDEVKKLTNPVFHIHKGNVPKINTYGISFSLLLNLSAVCNPQDKSVLWGFVSQYAPEANKDNAPYLDHMLGYAVTYYNDFIKDSKKYLEADDKQKKLLKQIKDMLTNLADSASAEEIQNQIYAIGREAGYENLRDFFKEIYEILLGSAQGPRLGSFFKLFGIENTINLINSKIE